MRQETKQQMRILAHDEMRVQHHFFMQRGQVVERAHRHIHFVAHALHVQHNLRRILFQQDAAQSSDHVFPLLKINASDSSVPCTIIAPMVA